MIRRILFALTALVAAAAAATGIEPKISAELANRTAFLGDPVALTVRVHFEDGWTFEQIELPEKLGEATVLNQRWIGPIRDEETGLNLLELRAELAWYRFETFETPPIELRGVAENGDARTFATPAMTIEIIEMLEEEDQSLAPEKGQVSMQAPALWPFLVGGALLLLALGGLVAWLAMRYAKRPKRPAKPVKPLAPPDQEALERLRVLTHGPLLKEGKFKLFYVEINQIIRHYYARLFDIHAEEMTSFELEDWMDDRADLSGEQVALNRAFQELCDRVKFAKHDPLDAENKDVVNWSYQIVEAFKPEPEPTTEEEPHVATG